MDPAQQNPPTDSPFPPPPSTEPATTPAASTTPAETPAVTPPLESAIPANSATLPTTPAISVISSTQQSDSKPQSDEKKGGVKTLGIILALFAFIILGSSAAAYLVATEKIPAPSPQIKQFASSIVFSVPFIPKTPGYVVDSFIANSQNYTSSSFDLSVAATSTDFDSLIGGGSFDFQASGFADFKDKDRPVSEIRLLVSNQLDAEIKQTPEKVFFKISKIPPFLYLFLGLTPEQIEPLFLDWISADTAKLDTQARSMINSSEESASPMDESTLTAFKKVFTEDVRPYLKLSTENLDGVKTHKLEFSPTPDQLDTLIKNLGDNMESLSKQDLKTDINTSSEMKPSQLISSPKFQAWIDPQNRLRKISVNATFTPESIKGAYPDATTVSPSFSAPIDFAVVLSVSDFNKSFTVTPPQTSIALEDFFAKINQQFVSDQISKTSTPNPLALPTQ